MKDIQGNSRGPCSEDCMCVEYVVQKNGDSKCDYCGHLPTHHKLLNSPAPVQPVKQAPSVKEKEKEEPIVEEKKQDQTVYTPPSAPKNNTTPLSPAVAPSGKEAPKKKTLLQELKNPGQFIKDKRKQKKAWNNSKFVNY